MRALNNADFLTLWENGQRLHPLDRGLFAIRSSLPTGHADPAQEEPVADWALGRRNRALIHIHMMYFGPRLEGWTSCSQCGEQLEFDLDCRALLEAHDDPQPQEVLVAGTAFRLPTSRDLAQIAELADPQQAALHLVQSCALHSSRAPGETWSQDEIEAVALVMSLADPLAEIALDFDCPVCGSAPEETLDLPVFLWTEIETRARRLLLEIHALARSYGWAESAILAMSDIRRSTYLQMVQA